MDQRLDGERGLASRRPFFGGRPRPAYGGGASGPVPWGQAVVVFAMPTVYLSPRSVSPSRDAVLSPYPASASTGACETPLPAIGSIRVSAICYFFMKTVSSGTQTRSLLPGSCAQAVGRYNRNATGTDAVRFSNDRVTATWQLAFFRGTPQVGWATPTGCFPFFGKPVSSTIQASTGPRLTSAPTPSARTRSRAASSLYPVPGWELYTVTSPYSGKGTALRHGSWLAIAYGTNSHGVLLPNGNGRVLTGAYAMPGKKGIATHALRR